MVKKNIKQSSSISLQDWQQAQALKKWIVKANKKVKAINIIQTDHKNASKTKETISMLTKP